MTEEQISKLPKHRKDWLECFGNQWAPTKTAGVACLACVYGDRHGYGHSVTCPKNPWNKIEYVVHIAS